MTNLKNPLADVDVEGLITSSVKKSLKPMQLIGESYVAEPKPYTQVTEFVSQKTKEAHTALYQGYVETLNRVSAELDTVSRGEADSRHSAFKNLKQDEAENLAGVWLHELYFSGFYDPHSEIYMDSSAYIEFERSWGTFEDWQKDFIACAMASPDGWAICGYHLFLKRFVNTFINDNSENTMIGLYPVIVLDVHEHSYVRDYGNDKKSYVIAMMREINWNVIEERVNKAKSIATVLK